MILTISNKAVVLRGSFSPALPICFVGSSMLQNKVLKYQVVYKVTLVQCDQKKSPNVYKSCPKMISLEK